MNFSNIFFFFCIYRGGNNENLDFNFDTYTHNIVILLINGQA